MKGGIGIEGAVLPIGKRVGRPRLAGQVQQVHRVAGGVARRGDALRGTGVQVVLRDRDGLLQIEGRFDECRDCGCLWLAIAL